MYTTTIEAMVQHLADRGCLNPVITQETISAALLDFWKDKIAIVWTLQDVKDQAGEMGHVITDDDADNVLSYVWRKHDGAQGVSWSAIRDAIRHFVPRARNVEGE